MIDIIIPAYNAHETIDRCIASILTQTERDFAVTIVNDGGKNYEDVINRYKDLIKIREIGYADNRGPGMARQYGYDNTSSEFVTFMDADDTFYGAFALSTLLAGIKEDVKIGVCVGSFIEENEVGMIPHEHDMIWMFGKMYRRSFINYCGIRFCPGSRWNEDNGWNTCVRLFANERGGINFIDDVVYCWHSNPNSITRKDDCRYSYDKSFVGYVENMLWAITHVKKYEECAKNVRDWTLLSCINIYQYLVEMYSRDRRFLKQAWAWTQVFYDKAIAPIQSDFEFEEISAVYTDVMYSAYERGAMAGVIPFMTFAEFLYKLENKLELEYDEEDISEYYPSDSAWLVIR